jgi:hypothetical protein
MVSHRLWPVMTGVLNAVVGQRAPILLRNRTWARSASQDGFAGINFNSDGSITVDDNIGGGTTQNLLPDYSWLSSASVGFGNNYEIRATETSGTVSSGSDATATWLALSSNRRWVVAQLGVGVKSCTLTVEIRDAATDIVRASASITLTYTRT